MPPTELVEDLRAVEQALIFEQVAGKRNWEELLRTHLADYYAGNPEDLERAIAVSLSRIQNSYVPTCLMEVYREEQRFNQYAACK